MNGYTLITGASSGIGLAAVKVLASSTKLILHGRDTHKLEDLREEVGKEHLVFCHDLTDLDNLSDSLIGFLKDNNILIDKVIHCAGIDQTLPVKSLRASSVSKIMTVNFYSIIEILNVLLKKSVNQSALKNILFISSISSIRGFKAKAAYSASKSALDSYMRVLSKELAPNVVVNSILPGAVPTPMSEDVFKSEKMISHFEEVYPLGIGSVDQIVDVIKFYHDLSNGWVTGQQVIVDGGFTS